MGIILPKKMKEKFILMQFETEYTALRSLPATVREQQALREELQNFFQKLQLLSEQQLSAEDYRALQHLTEHCLHKLRKLQNSIACAQKELPLAPYDLVRLPESLCVASDFALSGSERRVFFRSEVASLPVFCNARSLAACIMNLLCNALAYGKGSEVLCTLRVKDESALLQIIQQGTLPLARCFKSIHKTGSGLCAADTAARANGCRLLLHNGGGEGRTILCLPLAAESLPLRELPDFTELLCDRLSPVSVGLNGICRVHC